ncbi:unnamed protein product [Diatraea saccharalis]|uniref:Tyrosine-protein phosphatase domain-containing protein n=1 Tax=Diatraea saccharalis TaxID=40085 RepID=A0A9N9R213_9NEOP|nr:unnamed protein product [Diatraea saccharalis]
MHYVNVYKPPPPYPSNGLASNSTPDLAVASQALNYHRGYINSHVSGSSPDLVSTRTALNRQYLGYLTGSHGVINYARPNVMPAHGTYNNLTSVLEPNPHIIIDPHHVSDSIQKVYDERGNIMYSMPMHRPYQRHIVLSQTQQIKLNDTQEPIYENVPLPWQSEKGTMRDRAQSLTTTDEIARLNERNSSHPNINRYGNLKQTSNVPSCVPTRVDNPDSHYVNAQIIKGVRESSVPKDDRSSNRSVDKSSDFENVALSAERLSLKDDETPYQSLSTRVSNNNTINKENVTTISIDQSNANRNVSMSDSSTINVTDDGKSNVSSKEKKRRRWGVFMGRGVKAEVRSATLGRDRAKPAPQPANKHRWSTGLPKFQPLPPSITKETLCQLLERKMSEEQISFAFERLPKGREKGGSVATALLPQYAALNGYSGDSLPYDDNRVRLKPTPANPHGYINASHVTMTVGSSQRFYVVIKVGTGRTGAPAGAGVGAGAACTCGCSGVWECAWQVGARLLALVGDSDRPHYLPPDNTTVQMGEVSGTR